MYERNYRDLLGGCILLLIGGGVALISVGTMRLGTFQNMGPGFFPTALGLILAAFGVMIAIPAWFREGEAMQAIQWRSTFCVLASLAAFALVQRLLGIIPATALLIFVAHLAEPKFKPLSLLGMLLFLPGLAYLIFKVGLNLPAVMFRWPW